MHNRLIHEKSPYLLQHARNPVDWFAWGDEAFREAKRRDLPIFLSIGYATCHWCHVMEKESFEDPEIAALMNASFINIKVDREELPAVDSTYMEFAQVLMSASGGWPLNVLLTPDLKPFFAVTYLPKENQEGQIGMGEFLPYIAALWKGKEREQLVQQAEKLVAAFQELFTEREAGELPTQAVMDTAFAALYAEIDPVYGGFKGAPKFPLSYAALAFLEKDRKGVALAERSLLGMQRGGIYDVVGGGFSRYAVDEAWKIPHFEKMLYDNALLAMSYLRGWQVTRKEVFLETARETLEYLLREMVCAEGGFYSAQDADTEGEEGVYYTWTLAEIQKCLPGKEGDWFALCYGVSAEGNFEERNVLYTEQSVEECAEVKKLKGARRTLFQEREKRQKPLTDDKIITAWNGLMIDVLARASGVFPEWGLLEVAKRTARFLRNKLHTERGLLRRFRDGEAKFEGVLEDYAFVIKGVLSLFEEGGGTEWLEWALQLTEQLEEKFVGVGGYYAQEDHESLLVRRCEFHDAAEPSGNAVHCENLLRLYQITWNQKYLRRAEGVLKGARKTVEAYPPGGCYHLLALGRYLDQDAQTLVVALGTTGKEEVQKRLAKKFVPHQCVVYREQGDSLLTQLVPSLVDKNPVDGQTAIYICTRKKCAAPVGIEAL